MELDIRFFASYRDLVGTEQVRVSLPEACTVAEMLERLRARGEGFSRLPSSPAVAVNRTVAGPETVLSVQDEVALLPPVAGG